MRSILKSFFIIVSKLLFVLLTPLCIYIFFGTAFGRINRYTSSSTTSDGQTSFSSGIYREGIRYEYALFGLLFIIIGYAIYSKQFKSYIK